ncbi:MAG: endolytic transglycosylase MltG [Lachnospiraceae bacterium]|nr:endolytic transglycosylase MltG [Lachnospiraceae bacterium]
MNKLKDLTIAFTGTVVRVALLILAVICIGNYAGKAYEFGYRLFTEEPMSAPPGRDITVVVNSSDSQSDIIQMLEDKGLIRDHRLFTVQKKLSIYKDKIEPGSYDLNTSMNSDEILEILVGKETEDDELSSPDGLTDVTDSEDADLTGLDEAGVLGDDDTQYDEAAAFAEDQESENEYEGEGDEESAIEE